MALYEYFCRECETSFELRRPMGAADRDVCCPDGHIDVRRQFAVFASVRGSSSTAAAPSMPTPSMGGGGCGSSCGCGH